MRRTSSLLLLGLLALSTLAMSPAATSTDSDGGPGVCIRFREYDVPFTGVTIDTPGDRFCAFAPSPGSLLPGEQG